MELLNYQQFSERFPYPGDSEKVWQKLLLRFRDKGLLRKDKHYRLKFFKAIRHVYDVRSVVRVICIEARKDKPLPTAFHLLELHYDAFCDILQPVPTTPNSPNEQANTPD